jgi:hypothetical protein
MGTLCAAWCSSADGPPAPIDVGRGTLPPRHSPRHSLCRTRQETRTRAPRPPMNAGTVLLASPSLVSDIARLTGRAARGHCAAGAGCAREPFSQRRNQSTMPRRQQCERPEPRVSTSAKARLGHRVVRDDGEPTAALRSLGQQHRLREVLAAARSSTNWSGWSAICTPQNSLPVC